MQALKWPWNGKSVPPVAVKLQSAPKLFIQMEPSSRVGNDDANRPGPLQISRNVPTLTSRYRDSIRFSVATGRTISTNWQ
ncbi:hypothetical protein GWI33_006588 [Rhynchophorus ferrugineus]|uniref:Uncharacterized protein n=1 Tax=Rhynchophorus ferrugineus TaxID=354439 RepID=A0A834MGI2_RHYFE|nr:hypothetical protein GWI33_006588 [Rhynchophorus ferrugineus]